MTVCLFVFLSVSPTLKVTHKGATQTWPLCLGPSVGGPLHLFGFLSVWSKILVSFTFYVECYCKHSLTKLMKTLIFTAWAMLSRYMPWPCVCVCLSVCVCPSQVGVLLKLLNIGTHKQHRMIARDSSKLILMPKSFSRFERCHPNGGAKCRWSRSKLANFNK